MKTITPIKKAAGLTAAGQMKLQTKTYRKTAQLSSLKILIGELLLFGNKKRKEFWGLFEVLLTQYIQNLREYASEPPESTKLDKKGND